MMLGSNLHEMHEPMSYYGSDDLPDTPFARALGENSITNAEDSGYGQKGLMPEVDAGPGSSNDTYDPHTQQREREERVDEEEEEEEEVGQEEGVKWTDSGDVEGDMNSAHS